MHTYAVFVLLAATVFGAVNARVTSGVSATLQSDNEVGLACPHKAVPNKILSVLYVMLNKVSDCYRPSSNITRQIEAAADTSAYRRLFRSACVQVPSVRACIARVAVDVHNCLNGVERNMWAIALDFLDTCITVTCADDGEIMAAIFGDEFRAMSVSNLRSVDICMDGAETQTMMVDTEADLPAFTLQKYRSVKKVQQCILNVAKQGQTSANQFKHFTDNIINSLKCLTPSSYEIVPCETLKDAIDN